MKRSLFLKMVATALAAPKAVVTAAPGTVIISENLTVSKYLERELKPVDPKIYKYVMSKLPKQVSAVQINMDGSAGKEEENWIVDHRTAFILGLFTDLSRRMVLEIAAMISSFRYHDLGYLELLKKRIHTRIKNENTYQQ